MNTEDDYKDFLSEFLNKPQEHLPYKKEATIEEKVTPKTAYKPIMPLGSVVNSYLYNKDKYEEIFIKYLPLGEFYPIGTKIHLRPCITDEIQNFSTYDRDNPFDFKYKLNDIIEKCVILEKPNGEIDSYLNLFDNDRIYLIYTIREKTFPHGKKLYTTVKYNNNGKIEETHIENNRSNLDVWRDESIMGFYNKDKNVFEFETTLREEPYIIKPPTIGLKNSFDQYMMIKAGKHELSEKKDSMFYRIAPYMKPNISYMSYEELEEYENWFKEELSPTEFSFLLDLINNQLKIGIRGLKKNTGGATIRTHKVYPDRPESLFIIPNAFRLYLKQ